MIGLVPREVSTSKLKCQTSQDMQDTSAFTLGFEGPRIQSSGYLNNFGPNWFHTYISLYLLRVQLKTISPLLIDLRSSPVLNSCFLVSHKLLSIYSHSYAEQTFALQQAQGLHQSDLVCI